MLADKYIETIVSSGNHAWVFC